MIIQAVQYIKPMDQGWTLPHLLKCDDNHTYVVKFMNNPDGPGILANELIAYRLGKLLGLQMAPCRIIRISSDFIDMHPVLKKLEVPPGAHLGSLYFEQGITTFDENDLSICQNASCAAGMIAFDHWINNGDRHLTQSNLLYLPDKRMIQLIDHADAFFGPDWDVDNWMYNLEEDLDLFWGPLYEMFVPFIDSPDPFDHYVSRIEAIGDNEILSAMSNLPKQWDIPRGDLSELKHFLLHRKNKVRETLYELKEHFPIWNESEDDD